MDSESEDDMLYYSHQKLSSFIRQASNKNEAIKTYLENLNYQPIRDFNQGLEWFNVSEPLSFAKHLKGKIVVLDFFTYCCINCMHILPDLREIEQEFSVKDGLVVIGVHSAKFENEKVSANILAAVQRYNIKHPVVNDFNSQMWKNCEVNCWPTLLILGPSANPIVMLMGEGHKENLRLYIRTSLEYYKSKNLISDHLIPFKSAYHLLPDHKGPLLFPGKIAICLDDVYKEVLAISDTGNNRILLVEPSGSILLQIGSGKVGFRDGSLSNSEFNAPQGLTFQKRHIIYVADTENHAIRRIDLLKKIVETVVGTGLQGNDQIGGNLWKNQIISSPWDVCIYRTPNMDMTFYPNGDPPLRDVLLIAMAGTHQIWALFLEETVWWKCRKYQAGSCVSIAGSGKEENKNNVYPHAAGFAQPSGLALCKKNREVYIADSESSCVRRLSLVDGKVTPVVGGDKNPNNLFAYGDRDGSLCEAKLQHLLGLSISKDEDTLLVADTYNHKLKKVNLSQNQVTTINTPSLDTIDGESSLFREPAGLCLSLDGKRIYLADTNNHCIKMLKIGNDFSIKSINKLELTDDAERNNQPKSQLILSQPIGISQNGGKLIITLDMSFIGGLKLTEDAPQKWSVKMPDSTWSCIPCNGDNLNNIDVVVSVPSGNLDDYIDFEFDIVTCTIEVCLPKTFIIRIPVKYQNGKQTHIETNLNIDVDANNIQIKV